MKSLQYSIIKKDRRIPIAACLSWLVQVWTRLSHFLLMAAILPVSQRAGATLQSGQSSELSETC